MSLACIFLAEGVFFVSFVGFVSRTPPPPRRQCFAAAIRNFGLPRPASERYLLFLLYGIVVSWPIWHPRVFSARWKRRRRGVRHRRNLFNSMGGNVRPDANAARFDDVARDTGDETKVGWDKAPVSIAYAVRCETPNRFSRPIRPLPPSLNWRSGRVGIDGNRLLREEFRGSGSVIGSWRKGKPGSWSGCCSLHVHLMSMHAAAYLPACLPIQRAGLDRGGDIIGSLCIHGGGWDAPRLTLSCRRFRTTLSSAFHFTLMAAVTWDAFIELPVWRKGFLES